MIMRGTSLWPPYHWIDEPANKPLKDFWEATYDQTDVSKYQQFVRMLYLRKRGMRDSEISKALRMNNVGKYLSGQKKSFITHMRMEHERLGRPRECYKWLPLRLKPRGTPDKDWIQVPETIQNYKDVVSVLEQLQPTEDSFSMMGHFGYRSREEVIADRANLFGFFGGALVRDAGKPEKGSTRFPSSTASLTLSQNKRNSYRFGEFASFSVNASLGLRMHRISDAPSSNRRYTKATCYRWITPASPILSWTFRVFLGLTEDERTTHEPIKMNWPSAAPREFRIHFLQGLLESDGWAIQPLHFISSLPPEDDSEN